jgi:hypothetical protein
VDLTAVGLRIDFDQQSTCPVGGLFGVCSLHGDPKIYI